MASDPGSTCAFGDGGSSARLVIPVVGVLADEEAEAEGVSGRIGVHLEVVSPDRAASGFEDQGTEAHHVRVRCREVLDPEVVGGVDR